MIEKICPIHRVPVFSEKCSKDGCEARPIVSTTLYWCEKCNVPSFYSKCHCCDSDCKYVSTDMRPVFPEEKLLLAILLKMNSPLDLDKVSVWNSNSGYYFDGKRVPFSVGEFNRLPIDEIKQIKTVFDKPITFLSNFENLRDNAFLGSSSILNF